MPDYSKSKIYKIVCNKTGLQYFGSTIQTLAQRLAKHRCMSSHCTSKKIIVNGDYNIILVEEYPCESKYELEKRERFYIETNDCINKQYPTRTKKEYEKLYREANKEKFKEYQKQYQKQYYEENKEKIKEHYQANKEKLKEYQKKRYKNKKNNNNNNI